MALCKWLMTVSAVPRRSLKCGVRHERDPRVSLVLRSSPPRSEAKEPEEYSEVSPARELKLIERLPPNCEVLRDENGVTEEKPPKSYPCFRAERDPDGRLRHLAGLLLH